MMRPAALALLLAATAAAAPYELERLELLRGGRPELTILGDGTVRMPGVLGQPPFEGTIPASDLQALLKEVIETQRFFERGQRDETGIALRIALEGRERTLGIASDDPSAKRVWNVAMQARTGGRDRTAALLALANARLKEHDPMLEPLAMAHLAAVKVHDDGARTLLFQRYAYEDGNRVRSFARASVTAPAKGEPTVLVDGRPDTRPAMLRAAVTKRLRAAVAGLEGRYVAAAPILHPDLVRLAPGRRFFLVELATGRHHDFVPAIFTGDTTEAWPRARFDARAFWNGLGHRPTTADEARTFFFTLRLLQRFGGGTSVPSRDRDRVALSTNQLRTRLKLRRPLSEELELPHRVVERPDAFHVVRWRLRSDDWDLPARLSFLITTFDRTTGRALVTSRSWPKEFPHGTPIDAPAVRKAIQLFLAGL